jgi:quinolinate synthase
MTVSEARARSEGPTGARGDGPMGARGEGPAGKHNGSAVAGLGGSEAKARVATTTGAVGGTTTGARGDTTAGTLGGEEWAEEVRRLAGERDAVILAHNYQLPEIQDVADHVGDSLALSRLAASSPASVIVFAGVYFMAETAKILSPAKTVLIPDQRAGCSLADSITGAQLREWKAGHPGAAVVAYVNTSAEVKAEADVCCTSANAAEVVNSIPADREVLFCPDQFLGAHVRRVTGRKNLQIWAGECHVHAAISGPDLAARVAAEPDAELFIHPECGCATSALYLAGEGVVPADRVRILSTGGMLTAAQQAHQARQAKQTAATPPASPANQSSPASPANQSSPASPDKRSAPILVATEIGMLHQLRKAAPEIDFRPVNERASCRYMKMITPAALLRSLQEGRDEVTVPDEVAGRARAAVQKMISIGKPGGAE